MDNQSGSAQCICLHDKVVSRKRPLLTGRVGPGVLLVDNHIYVVGGLTSLSEVDNGQEQPTPERSCERFDIRTNTWEHIAEQSEGGAKSCPSLVAVQAKKWLY